MKLRLLSINEQHVFFLVMESSSAHLNYSFKLATSVNGLTPSLKLRYNLTSVDF